MLASYTYLAEVYKGCVHFKSFSTVMKNVTIKLGIKMLLNLCSRAEELYKNCR